MIMVLWWPCSGHPNRARPRSPVPKPLIPQRSGPTLYDSSVTWKTCGGDDSSAPFGLGRSAAGRPLHCRRHRMTKKPQPLLRWDIYRAAAKARLLGTVEAKDAEGAIAEAAKQFGGQGPQAVDCGEAGLAHSASRK